METKTYSASSVGRGSLCLCESGILVTGIRVGGTVNKAKILLTGTCWYELTGLWYLLSEHGYNVYRVPLEYSATREGWSLIIVALSAESVAGWGRHLSRIREMRAVMHGEMLILVPEKLKMLKILRNVCQVYSGCENLSSLEVIIHMALKKKLGVPFKFRLTSGQRRILTSLLERDKDSSLSLKRKEKAQYYYYARLAENVGVRDVRMLVMTRLDREILEMEDEERGK